MPVLFSQQCRGGRKSWLSLNGRLKDRSKESLKASLGGGGDNVREVVSEIAKLLRSNSVSQGTGKRAGTLPGVCDERQEDLWRRKEDRLRCPVGTVPPLGAHAVSVELQNQDSESITPKTPSRSQPGACTNVAESRSASRSEVRLRA